jgi:peptide/nickel transport system substrate-binding protein
MSGRTTTGLSRRRLLELMGTAATASFLAGCVSSPSAVGTSPAPAPSATPKRGGTLRIAQLSDFSPPRFHSITFVNYQVLYQVFDTLTRYDSSLTARPELAESWSWSSDNKTLTLKLRPGVKYHTGREFGAEDVKFNLLRVQDAKVASQMRAFATDIKEIQTPDTMTVVLKFDAPRPAIFDMFESLVMADRDTIAEAEGSKRWVGTGPFKWGEWAPGVRLTLVRNDSYWKSGLPYLDGVVVQPLPDAPSALVNLEAGSVDVVVSPLEPDVKRLQADPRFGVLISEFGGQYYSFGANVSKPPLNDKRVRQAINYAIDRKRFVDTVLAGIGEPTAIPWPKRSPAYEADLANSYKFDLDRSRQLLQQAGVGAAGIDITIVANASNPNLAKAAQIAQADLAKVGVRIKIDQLESAAFGQLLNGRKVEQMWANVFGFNNMQPSTLMIQAFPWRISENPSYYDSPEYTRLVREAQVATDPARQKASFHELTQLVLDESFMYPLTPQKNTWAFRSELHGAEDTVFGMLALRGAWLA